MPFLVILPVVSTRNTPPEGALEELRTLLETIELEELRRLLDTVELDELRALLETTMLDELRALLDKVELDELERAELLNAFDELAQPATATTPKGDG